MLQKLFITAMAATLLISCTSKKKSQDGSAGEGDGTGGAPDISSVNMNFDPTGSDSGAISGLNTVYFAYDSSSLDSENQSKLKANAEWIKSRANIVMQLEGHCDDRGSVEYNLALGERRAKAVKSLLVSMGVESKKLRVVSYGEEKPVASGDGEEAYSKNRRANFVPLPQ